MLSYEPPKRPVLAANRHYLLVKNVAHADVPKLVIQLVTGQDLPDERNDIPGKSQ